MKTFKIAALAGDGIGPEVMREAIKVLRATEKKFRLQAQITEAPVGWAGIDAAGKALPDATLALCKNRTRFCSAPSACRTATRRFPKKNVPNAPRCCASARSSACSPILRPVKLPKALAHACPLAKERQGDGIDILVVRELTGGMYFGQPKKTEDLGGGHQRAMDTMVYTTPEIERIAHVAFQGRAVAPQETDEH